MLSLRPASFAPSRLWPRALRISVPSMSGLRSGLVVAGIAALSGALSGAVLVSGTLAGARSAASAEGAIGAYEIEGRKSGYLFLDDAVRALQDDDFLNPAMFTIDRGRALWNRKTGPDGQSCASCHGAAESSMRGVAARYPRYDATIGRLVNLELRINDELVKRMKAEPFRYESNEMLALTAYVAMQSRGLPMEADIEGPGRAFFEKGRAFYNERRGQLDLACAQCHDALAGSHLRGDLISQGQINGFPIYRLSWQSMASRHRLFEWCNTSIRAEPLAYGSEEYLSLELFLAWRGRGLPIEAPAVRR